MLAALLSGEWEDMGELGGELGLAGLGGELGLAGLGGELSLQWREGWQPDGQTQEEQAGEDREEYGNTNCGYEEEDLEKTVDPTENVDTFDFSDEDIEEEKLSTICHTKDKALKEHRINFKDPLGCDIKDEAPGAFNHELNTKVQAESKDHELKS